MRLTDKVSMAPTKLMATPKNGSFTANPSANKPKLVRASRAGSKFSSFEVSKLNFSSRLRATGSIVNANFASGLTVINPKAIVLLIPVCKSKVTSDET